MNTAVYREHHRALRDLVARIPSGIVPGTAELVRPLLIKLSDVLTTHLKLEEEHLYPAMLADVDPGVRARAEDFQAEMGGLAEAFGRFVERWTVPHAVSSDPAAFSRDWAGIRSALAGRMDREDRDLYALVDSQVDLPA